MPDAAKSAQGAFGGGTAPPRALRAREILDSRGNPTLEVELGANALLGVSLACAHACARALDLPNKDYW